MPEQERAAGDRFGYANRMRGMHPSTIREILKAASQPDMISFAGGLPAPELFPVAEVADAAAKVLRDLGARALQYSESEGYPELRRYIAADMARRGIACSPEEVLVTTGSQQALDLIGKVFIDAGDSVLTENPTYLAAIQAFQGYQARFVPAPTDSQGILPEALPELIRANRPKLLYTIPNFQNPTGATMSADRRAALLAIAHEHGLLIVEDDPYGRLRYAGTHIPPIRALGDPAQGEAQVLYVSTFSKTIAPGLRVGWIVAPSNILDKLVIAKQASDLHSSSFDQPVALTYLLDNDNDAHVERVRVAYGARYRAMDAALACDMPRGFTWTHPEGGMFLWVTCPPEVDTMRLLTAAMAEKVLFVPGRDFFPDGTGHRYMRLNFSSSGEERIRDGVSRLARLCAMPVGP